MNDGNMKDQVWGLVPGHELCRSHPAPEPHLKYGLVSVCFSCSTCRLSFMTD